MAVSFGVVTSDTVRAAGNPERSLMHNFLYFLQNLLREDDCFCSLWRLRAVALQVSHGGPPKKCPHGHHEGLAQLHVYVCMYYVQQGSINTTASARKMGAVIDRVTQGCRTMPPSCIVTRPLQCNNLFAVGIQDSRQASPRMPEHRTISTNLSTFIVMLCGPRSYGKRCLKMHLPKHGPCSTLCM